MSSNCHLIYLQMVALRLLTTLPSSSDCLLINCHPIYLRMVALWLFTTSPLSSDCLLIYCHPTYLRMVTLRLFTTSLLSSDCLLINCHYDSSQDGGSPVSHNITIFDVSPINSCKGESLNEGKEYLISLRRRVQDPAIYEVRKNTRARWSRITRIRTKVLGHSLVHLHRSLICFHHTACFARESVALTLSLTHSLIIRVC